MSALARSHLRNAAGARHRVKVAIERIVERRHRLTAFARRRGLPRAVGCPAKLVPGTLDDVLRIEAGAVCRLARWRVLFLSTGEQSLSDKMAEANRGTHAGQETRFIDIPADARAGMGALSRQLN